MLSHYRKYRVSHVVCQEENWDRLKNRYLSALSLIFNFYQWPDGTLMVANQESDVLPKVVAHPFNLSTAAPRIASFFSAFRARLASSSGKTSIWV